jgi:hypothetical protein
MYQKTLLLSLSLFCSIIAISQKPPMTFGKVDNADLEMKFYPADSSAIAVVLCNYGYFDSRQFQFVHQMRIKILKEEGKARGDFFVPASEKAIVKGQTVNFENGIKVVTKLSKESIFIEKYNKDKYRARVAMPNVKVGSVLDVEFYYSGLPTYWNFQESIPVKWSELIIEENQYVSYRKNMVGFIPLAISTSDRWVSKDVQAFATEPFINNYKNYLTRFDIEISSIQIPGVLYKEYATSWDAVAETLRRESSFGQELASIQLFLNGLVKQIKSETTKPEEQLVKAFEQIKKIKWNSNSTIWIPNTGLSFAYSKKIGNVSEINLSLVLLLRKLDIDANPLVLSTRDNGVLPSYSVSLDKLNYVVAHAVIGEKTYLLDASEENIQIDMLPERAINGRGFLVKKETQEWVDLSPKKKNKYISLISLKLTPEGSLNGSWIKSSYEYAALKLRNFYKSFNNQDEYLKSVESSNIGLSIENYIPNDFDSIQKPCKEEFSVVLKNRVIKSNNQLFISPVQFDRYLENPFKAEQRLYPIDFVTAVEKMQLLRIELPVGYDVEQLPKNVKMTLPDNVASFQMQSFVSENIIQILYKLNINKSIFYQPEYLDLKSFFDELVKKQSEMLVIKKI